VYFHTGWIHRFIKKNLISLWNMKNLPSRHNIVLHGLWIRTLAYLEKSSWSNAQIISEIGGGKSGVYISKDTSYNHNFNGKTSLKKKKNYIVTTDIYIIT
jgi:hypothetical protein